MKIEGVLIGAGAFLIIGLLHPVIIHGEYRFGKGIWPIFLGLGLLCAAASLFIQNVILSALTAVLGFSLLWSIHELFEQEERVRKGWFPQNPCRKKTGKQAGEKF